ncbi:MAG: alpha-ketoglutarate-dependent dioxygenase AlkB [Alphaproteobacteria bacterium]|nr:alpha-ketoglutarate-dependent dioxygenase AlkB [Alphaproteobacteria bacterium]
MSAPRLFDNDPALPEGLRYATALLDAGGEEALVRRMREVPFAAFAFHGFEGKRRTHSYGWHYVFDGSGLQAAEPIPDWLLPLRDKAARWAGLAPERLEHVLLTEYAPGAAIGWHRDRAVFGDVVGVSLLSPARLRFRRKAGARWERRALVVAPRSAYLLSGPARTEWEHSIPPAEALRYSVTFRTMK